MAEQSTIPERIARLGERIADAVRDRGVTVAAAESVTAGNVAGALAAAPDASEWFAGSTVAYMTEAKRLVLGVTVDDVFTAECAIQLAEGASRVMDARTGVAVTGVGGPDPEGEHPVGEVYTAVTVDGTTEVERHEFDGEPADVIDQAVAAALEQLATALEALRN